MGPVLVSLSFHPVTEIDWLLSRRPDDFVSFALTIGTVQCFWL